VKGLLFDLLTKVFDLRSVSPAVWNPTECMLLYDEIKSYCFDSLACTAVFEAAAG
jgi:hypothetical protein